MNNRVKSTPPDFIGINGEIAGTLDASYYKGCGERQGIEREIVFQLRSTKHERDKK